MNRLQPFARRGLAALVCTLVTILAGADAARAQSGPSNAASPVEPRTIAATATVVPVGRWPEGLAWDGAALWIAESGVRRIASVDPAAGRVTGTVPVGRLPVDMAAAPDGTVYALVNTDKKVFAHKRGGRSAALAGVAGCPDHMTLSGPTLLVLTWPDCSSADSRIVAIDTATARARSSASLGRNAFGIAATGEHAWVAHSDGSVDVVDIASLARQATVAVGGFTIAIAAGNGAVFVAGRDRPQGGAPLVARIDAASRAVSHRLVLPGGETITALTVAGRHLVAAGEKGSLLVLAADDLRPLAKIAPRGWTATPAQRLLVVGERLYLTTHAGVGENGSLVMIDGWRP